MCFTYFKHGINITISFFCGIYYMPVLFDFHLLSQMIDTENELTRAQSFPFRTAAVLTKSLSGKISPAARLRLQMTQPGIEPGLSD